MSAPFLEWLSTRVADGPLGTDELLQVCLPLFEQVAEAHERGLVAPLDGGLALEVEHERPWFPETAARAPELNPDAVADVERPESRAFTVTAHVRWELDEAGTRVDLLDVQRPGDEVKRPVYLTGLMAWEQPLGHHDPRTDVFLLGLILGSLALGVDLSEEGDLRRFVGARGNPFALAPKLHPVVAKTITAMTALERRARPADLASVIQVLRDWRRAPLDHEPSVVDPSGEPGDPRRRALTLLRNRLFEISRRNRLLYFKPTLSMLNLTTASVPLSMSVERLSPDALCTWRGDVAARLSAGKPLSLSSLLRLEDAPYVPSVLERLRAEDRRSKAEYGFSQLRLVLVFLRWHDVKHAPEERISSPLLLLPVELHKKKGVRDAWVLEPQGAVAEVNPVLRHHLRGLYGLELPEEIDLGETSLEALHQTLEEAIQQSEPGVTVTRVEQPRLRIIQQRARARVETFRRRRRHLTGRGVRRQEGLDYSYAQDNFQPLGLQLFLHRVKRTRSALSAAARPIPAPRAPLMNEVRERQLYSLEEGGTNNPYVWDFDLTALTLGMFKYRKMSLVRDFTQLIEGEATHHPTFDALFEARRLAEAPPPPAPLEDTYAIVPADPTQAAAITRARTGASYIIQGPPGTGKSQTITNLIADYVARGKRVLFVCEKRAALDVVFHRLKQHGLEGSTALIHDSQGDKKAFIQDLRGTYEAYLAKADALAEREEERLRHVRAIERVTEQLARFDEGMQRVPPEHGVSTRGILGRLVALREQTPALSPEALEQLPPYRDFAAGQAALATVEEVLEDVGEGRCLGRHPLRLLGSEPVLADRPVAELGARITATRARLGELLTAVSDAELGGILSEETSLAVARSVMAYAVEVEELSALDQLTLLDPDHHRFRELEQRAAERERLQQAVLRTQVALAHWKQPILRGDLDDVIALAERVEGRALRFFSPAFWRVRGLFKARYDLAAHAVPPRWTRVLQALKEHYAAEDELLLADEAFLGEFRHGPAPALLAQVQDLHARQAALDAAQRAFRAHLLSRGGDRRPVRRLLAVKPAFDALAAEVGPLLLAPDSMALGHLAETLDALAERAHVLRDLRPALAELISAAPRLHQAAAEFPWCSPALEAGILTAALEAIYRHDRGLLRTDGPAVEQHVARLGEATVALRGANAQVVAARVHADFGRAVARAELPAGGVADREWKRQYTRGRRELEHEFSKVMRYKSIRDLAAGDTGAVLRDLKPIWLMSPLSVSDTLPLDPSTFDVVIFDEASQITLEEAVPALFRAPQAIVVGDEKQLPPTDFFSSRQRDDEDEDEDPETTFELDADSFLNRAARSLPSTMLGWHYRSRSEALISFSNAAFYGGQLLTVPDVANTQARLPIVATRAEDATAATVLDRPVGFHLMTHGAYDKRKNPAEAEYVAHLVRSLLVDENKLSIGVVAFSEAQQGELETALETLANEDPDFRARLEAEWEREEDGQLVGLFVKNLENVQGDERDVVILSVCYGPGPKGPMRMNFGPINKSGGERRLNVVFSRAKRHMVVVSTIRGDAITNDYNDGAACLKRYLRYAEAMSVGDTAAARRTLDEATRRPRTPTLARPDPVLEDVATALEAEGLTVDRDLGDSAFRCDLAVRVPGEPRYRLAVLLDRDGDRADQDPAERYLLRPEVLAAFGWRVTWVLAKDWHHHRDAERQRLLRLIGVPPVTPEAKNV